ncbi:MAG: c-type cytochrome biogenesis protein CcsB [Desulfobacterales bacterium]|nr:c-type cytochrome biogenesis protein CcsB [Desulfobacterales bacterium]
MEPAIVATIFFYLLSTAFYFAYLVSQKNRLHQTGVTVLVLGFACHSAAVVYGCIDLGHVPAENLHQTLVLAGWAVVGVFLALQARFKLRILGIYAAPLASLVMVMAFFLPREPVQVKNIFNSVWLATHIIAIFIGEAALALACGVGMLYLVQEHAIKTKHHGFFFKRLPSLDLLDSTGYACIVTGFALLSLGLITGFVYAKTIWGRFLSWDPKEVWSGITWLIYAALLHQRLTVGWRGRRAAIMAIVGFAVILFTFFGVNFLLQGHHGEFTRW